MPWEELEYPPIQLGILKGVLDRAGVGTTVRSVKLDWMEHCIRATADLPVTDRLGLADYALVVEWSRDFNLGDWIFSVPPFRNRSITDHEYLDLLRSWPMPEPFIAMALRFRAQVPAFLDRCVAEILATAPAIIGFTTGANQTVGSLVLSRLLKTHAPSLKIVLGGANCQGPMGPALHRNFPWVDAVVRGEGEAVLLPLVEDLLAGKTPRPSPGLCYRDGDRSLVIEEAASTVAMDDIPTPEYGDYFAQLANTSFKDELDGGIRLFYESARGCWWGAKSHCTFCGISNLVMPYRSKSPDRVVEELSGLATRYGRRDFLVVDYIIDWRYFRDVLPRLRDLGHDLHLFCETKANLKKDQVKLLRDAGFVSVQAGVESLSDPILKLMKKGVTAFQNIRLIKWCAELGVRLYWNVIYGLPGEPSEEYARMADVMRSLVHLEPPRFVPLSLDRFSPYHEDPAAFGLEVVGARRDYRHIYPVDDASLSDLAYTFEFRHSDGRDPRAYAEPLIRMIERWRRDREIGYGTLQWRSEGDGILITDRRPGLDATEYRLESTEAAIYALSADGASLDAIWSAAQAQRRDLSRDDVRDYLNDLADARLVYRDGERYLGLALPPPSEQSVNVAPAGSQNVELQPAC